jgi:hypothetical protein
MVEEDWSACLATLEDHDSPVMSVAFSPDGTRLASGYGHGRVNKHAGGPWRLGHLGSLLGRGKECLELSATEISHRCIGLGSCQTSRGSTTPERYDDSMTTESTARFRQTQSNASSWAGGDSSESGIQPIEAAARQSKKTNLRSAGATQVSV